MKSECTWNDFALFRRSSLVKSCSTSLPSGDQVGGLPPTVSDLTTSSNQVNDLATSSLGSQVDLKASDWIRMALC